MQIVVSFDSIEEFDAFRATQPVTVTCEGAEESTPEDLTVEPAEVEAVQEEPAVEAETETPPAPLSPEELKLEVKKLLARVNKETGENKAKEWIQELTGKKKLTEVDDLIELTKLYERAKEALNG